MRRAWGYRVTRDKQLDVAVQALRDVVNPIAALRRAGEVKGYILSPLATEVVREPSHYVRIASETLRRMGRGPR